MSNTSTVALVSCASYDEAEVKRAVGEAVGLIGGWGAVLKPEDRILLKPNLLRKAPPHAAVTTHPAVLKAVATLLREAGFPNLSYGDSPGGQSMESVAKTAGLIEAAEAIGLPAADFRHSVNVEHGGMKFPICAGAREADAIVNLPKMKTHALERITGAVKNLYGCVYSIHKAAGHAQYPNADSFAGMLIKLERALPAKLHIMDGVLAMEGNGPGSGDPVNMNVILASTDPYALDEVFCRLISLDPALVPTIAKANRSGDVEILTPRGSISWQEALSQYGKRDFNVDRGGVGGEYSLSGRILRAVKKRPEIKKSQCKSCMVCVESCPLTGKALFERGKYPVFDYKVCIRCYCCQEMCPHHAIVPRRAFFDGVLSDREKT